MMSLIVLPYQQTLKYYKKRYEKYVNLDRADILFELMWKDHLIDSSVIIDDIKCFVMYMLDKQPLMRASCDDLLNFIEVWSETTIFKVRHNIE